MELLTQKLTNEAFAPFGTFFDPKDGHGQDEISFLPDRVMHLIGTTTLNSISSICIHYRPIKIDVTEYHDDCEEVFGGFNCDTAFHVGQLGVNDLPDIASFKMFLLPQGMYVRLKRKILHHAAFTLQKSHVAFGIVLLSPAAYTIDCHVVHMKEPISVLL